MVLTDEGLLLLKFSLNGGIKKLNKSNCQGELSWIYVCYNSSEV